MRVWRKRSWRKRGCRKRVWRIRGWRERESGDSVGRVKVACAKRNNGTHLILDSICGFKKHCPGEPGDCRRTLCAREPATSQKGRAVERLRHLECVFLEKPNGSASPGTAFVQDLKGQRPRYIQPPSKHDKEQSRGHRLEISRHHRKPRHDRRSLRWLGWNVRPL